jgi:hypothetical protein
MGEGAAEMSRAKGGKRRVVQQVDGGDIKYLFINMNICVSETILININMNICVSETTD